MESYYKKHKVTDEEATVKKCMLAISKALDKNLPDGKAFHLEHFTITIGKEHFTFVMGGPQAQGLYLMLENIAKENGYDLK